MLTQARLKQVLQYNPKTGVFIRWGSRRKVSNGTPKRTATITVDSKRYSGNRLAYLYMVGKFPQADVLALNCDNSDLRWDNLILAVD